MSLILASVAAYSLTQTSKISKYYNLLTKGSYRTSDGKAIVRAEIIKDENFKRLDLPIHPLSLNKKFYINGRLCRKELKEEIDFAPTFTSKGSGVTMYSSLKQSYRKLWGFDLLSRDCDIPEHEVTRLEDLGTKVIISPKISYSLDGHTYKEIKPINVEGAEVWTDEETIDVFTPNQRELAIKNIPIDAGEFPSEFTLKLNSISPKEDIHMILEAEEDNIKLKAIDDNSIELAMKWMSRKENFKFRYFFFAGFLGGIAQLFYNDNEEHKAQCRD